MGLFWKCSTRNVIPWARLLTCGRARCSHKPVRQPAFKMLPQPVSPLSSCNACAVLSHVRLIVTPWTVAHQASPSMGFFRQEYWSGLPFPPPGDLPDPGTKLASPLSLALQADSLYTEPSGKPLSSWYACWVGVTGTWLRVAVLFIQARSSLLFPENVVLREITLHRMSAQHTQASHLRKGGL